MGRDLFARMQCSVWRLSGKAQREELFVQKSWCYHVACWGFSSHAGWLDALVVGLGFLAPRLVLSSLLGYGSSWKVEGRQQGIGYLKDAFLLTWPGGHHECVYLMALTARREFTVLVGSSTLLLTNPCSGSFPEVLIPSSSWQCDCFLLLGTRVTDTAVKRSRCPEVTGQHRSFCSYLEKLSLSGRAT